MVNRKIMKFKVAFYSLFIMPMTSFDVYAYLDPGTGGLLIQGLVAFLIGAGVFFKSIKLKVLDFFYRMKSGKLREKDE